MDGSKLASTRSEVGMERKLKCELCSFQDVCIYAFNPKADDYCPVIITVDKHYDKSWHGK